MATTRPVVPQARGEGVVGEVKQQKKMEAASEGRNRCALGDIGNVVNRPITRGFCAQLLANAQAAAAAENKKQVCVNVEAKAQIGVNKPAKKAIAAKAAQKPRGSGNPPRETFLY